MRGLLHCRPLAEAPRVLARRYLADPAHGWSVGCYGAIGEFQYAAGEPGLVLDLDGLRVRTARGSIEMPGIDRAQPYAILDEQETLREIAFCVADGGAGRDAVTQLDALTFDVGVGAAQVDMLVRLRPDDRETAAAMAAGLGKSLFAPGNPAGPAIGQASPTRILVSAVARLEVHQPIPPAGGRSPEGPHTHLLPKLLAQKRAHPPHSPLPDGLYCGLSLYPRSRRADDDG